MADLTKQRFLITFAMTLVEKAAETIGQIGYTLGDNFKTFIRVLRRGAGVIGLEIEFLLHCCLFIHLLDKAAFQSPLGLRIIVMS